MAIPKSNRYRCRCNHCGSPVDFDIPKGLIKHTTTTYSFKGIKLASAHDALALKQVYEILKEHPEVLERMTRLLRILDQEATDERKKNMKKEMGW